MHEELYIIDDVDAWSPSIRSKTAIRSSKKRNLIDPSIAVAAMGVSPQYFDKDFRTLGFLFESLCIRDLKIYTSAYDGKIGQNEVDEGAKHLCEIERLVVEYNEKEKNCPLMLPSLKLVVTATQYGYRRDDGVFVIPIGCLKN